MPNFGGILELGKFNVLIGANASGKSNFIQIFRFLKDIVNSGLDNAISLQGGVEYLRNINIGSTEDFSVTIVSDRKFTWPQETKKGLIGIKTYETTYEFALRFNKRGVGFKIVKDKLIQKFNFVKLEKKKKEMKAKETLGKGEIIVSRAAGGKVKIDLKKPEELSLKIGDIFPFGLLLAKIDLHLKSTLLEPPFFFMSPIEIAFDNTSIYDFDHRLSKEATKITGMAELEEDGSNLSIVLNNIIKNKDEKRKLVNLVKDNLGFIDDLDVERFRDKSLLFKLSEIYSKGDYLPAFLISDGTINITALIIALYFEKKSLTIVEEPERNIHPYLISKVIDMMKDASEKKQIIVTTHNPEVVKYTPLENILLVSRNDEGFSTVSRVDDKEEIKTFLQNKIGIEELYIQNLLGD